MWLKYMEWKQRQKRKRRKERLKSSSLFVVVEILDPQINFAKLKPRKLRHRQVLCFTSLKNIDLVLLGIYFYICASHSASGKWS